ncbi:MAG: hypothetical protein QM831_04230 [Kofleriaceae bacterium]
MSTYSYSAAVRHASNLRLASSFIAFVGVFVIAVGVLLPMVNPGLVAGTAIATTVIGSLVALFGSVVALVVRRPARI